MDIFLTLINISNFVSNRLMGLIQAAMSFGLMYGLYRLIKHFIRYHAECQNDFAEQREQKQYTHQELHREQQTSRVEQINRELDEIEASLNAVQDEKVTPIWELPRKD